ncbi:MAG: hypothetical protein K1X67_04985 [Fimbriimonadaceae bacterium]|nr:hypothetical protein [Fimbriimonadaceae bacterium]
MDRQPILVWSESPGHEADGVVVSLAGLADALRTHPDQLVLAEIVSPFGFAKRQGVDLNEVLRDDPARGEGMLSDFAAKVRDEVALALETGADGIFYRLDGAYPAASSPMEYGGHFLEIDRALLSEVRDARLNILFVEGGEETYFDCLTDLPAHVLAWDFAQTGIDVATMRAIRTGALAAPSDDADIRLLRSFDGTLDSLRDS